MSNASVIIAALKGAGLNSYAIAGVLGNLDIESHEDPNALNKREGAIGIAQWEGGRDDRLKQYAAQHGLAWNDIHAQAGFLVQEMQEMGIIGALNHAGSAGGAATVFDTQFERSAGTSRRQRVTAANSWFSSGLKGSGASPNDASSTALDTGSGGGGALPGGLAPDAYREALGSLSGLLDSVPELKNIFSQAVSGEWSTGKFQQAVQKSQWYRTHGDSVRQGLALQVADPATWAANIQKANTHVHQLASQLGVSLVGDEANRLAHELVLGAWDDATLQQHIGSLFKQNNGKAGGSVYGQAAALQQQLKQLAGDYGTGVGPDALNNWTQQILMGQNTIDGYKQFVQTGAKAKYPGLIPQIDSGLTVRQVADPYVQSMAQILEVNPTTVDISNDPTIRKALQGSTVVQDGKATTSATGLTQFEAQLRNDPRWQYTGNAKDQISSALVKIGQDWGFGF